MGAAPERSAEQEVLRIALEVAREVRAGPGAPAAGPFEMGSSLERDLGLDSLGRAELVARLERSVRGRPAGAGAGRRRDAGGPGPGRWRPPGLRTGPRASSRSRPGLETVADSGPVEAAPQRTLTLVEVPGVARGAPSAAAARALLSRRRRALELTYGELPTRATPAAAGLRAAGGGVDLERGQAVALMLPTGHDYFVGLLRRPAGRRHAGAALSAGAASSQIEDHLRRQAGILDHLAGAVALITFPEVMTVARLLRAQVAGLRRVTTVAELGRATPRGESKARSQG